MLISSCSLPILLLMHFFLVIRFTESWILKATELKASYLCSIRCNKLTVFEALELIR